MVQRKSEYKLKFNILSNDLRKQIWQENIRFREFCRSVNRADHFWKYQLTDEDAEESESVTSTLGVRDVPSATEDNAENVQERPVAKQIKKKSVAESNECAYKDTGVQTVGLQDIVLVEKDLDDKASTSGHTIASSTDEAGSKYKKRQKKPSITHTGLSPPSPYIGKTAKTTAESGRSSCKQDGSTDIRHLWSRSAASISPSRRSRSPSPRFSVLSRTSRRLHTDQKQPAFSSYGWNDSNRNVGNKKTYNIRAPQREVHPLALQALRNRRSEIEEYLTQEHQILNAAQKPMGTINHSSIWVTEYKEKYGNPFETQKPVSRRVSSRAQRPITWAVS